MLQVHVALRQLNTGGHMTDFSEGFFHLQVLIPQIKSENSLTKWPLKLAFSDHMRGAISTDDGTYTL